MMITLQENKNHLMFQLIRNHPLRRPCLAMLLLTVMLVGTSPAQSSVRDRIADLIRATESVRTQLDSPTGTTAPTAQPPSQPIDNASNARSETAPTDQAKEIRDRLRLLRQIRLQKPKAPQTQALQPVPSDTIELKEPKSDPTLDAPPKTMLEIEENIGASPAEESESTAVPLEMAATQVMSKAVDYLQLGQSLYQTKNYAAALKALKALEADTVSPEDKNWQELMIALCHLRLGDEKESETSLRELANINANDLVVPTARWWLSNLQHTSDARSRFSAVEAQLTPLMERMNQNAQ